MSAESRGTATRDGPKYLQLLIAEAGLEAFQELVALRTKDVCHLDGRSASWSERTMEGAAAVVNVRQREDLRAGCAPAADAAAKDGDTSQ